MTRQNSSKWVFGTSLVMILAMLSFMPSAELNVYAECENGQDTDCVEDCDDARDICVDAANDDYDRCVGVWGFGECDSIREIQLGICSMIHTWCIDNCDC